MKRILLFIVCVFALTVSLSAQTKQEKAVAAAVDQLKAALISGNKADLEAIAADKLSYGHSSGKIQNKTEFVEVLANGTSDFVTIELTDQTISVVGKTAIVRHKLAAKINDGGKPGSVNLGVMLVFQKESGSWKLLGRQAFKL